ncbi:MAG TPA: glycosyltransferase family 2 protein [Jiangellales bacterium]|nr:glycosyltransferase family 2 protein [Jiangellales bacterium]
MTSVVIAAHNEAAVIGRCLDALLADAAPGEFDITVVANGCRDETARLAAARPGVRVVELTEAGKAGALNAGDASAIGFPRIYLDADIVITSDGMRAVAAALGHNVLAAVPRRQLDLTRRPLLVRAFFAINARLPMYRDGLFGRGAIAVSAEARERFDRFPAMVADDLFLDALFTAEEKREVSRVAARVATPRRTRDLFHRLVRVRAGNAAMRSAAGAAAPANVRRARRFAWMRVVAARPWLAPAAVGYLGLTIAAAFTARRTSRDAANWRRDDSSRRRAESGSAPAWESDG